MASEVFSVKVSEELKDKIKALMDESGMQGNDFMDTIIRQYEIIAAKDIMPSAQGDLDELQAVTKRMNDIFVGLIERSNNLMKDQENALKAELDNKYRSNALVEEKLLKTYKTMESLKLENTDLNAKYQQMKEEVYRCDARIQDQEKSHENLLVSKEDLIHEYKQKNDTLNGVIAEYQEYKNENKVLAASIENGKVEIELLKKQVEEKERNEEKLKVQIEAIKAQNEVTLLKMQMEKEVAISTVQMEKEKAVLELREKHQSKYEELNNEYNVKVDEHNQKVKTLLDEIEKIRVNGSQIKS